MPITIGNRPNFGAAFDVVQRAVTMFSDETGIASVEPQMLGENAIEWKWSRKSDNWSKELIVNIEWRDPTLVTYTIQEAVIRDSDVFHLEPVSMELRARQLEKFGPGMVKSALLATAEHLSFMFTGFQRVYFQYLRESEELTRRADAGEFHSGITELLKGIQSPSQEPPEEVS